MIIYNEKEKITKKYSKFLKGKRIVIVSGSPYIIGSNQGELIDSYDIIVRINQGYMPCNKMKSDIGCRTDILYTSLSVFPGCGIDMDIKKVKNIFKWIVCPAYHIVDRINKFQKKINKNRISFHVVNKRDRDELIKLIGLKEGKEAPTTGMMAIYELLKNEISELYITGFTFYKLLPGQENDPFVYKEYLDVDGKRPLYLMYRGAGRAGRKGKKPQKQHPPNVEFNFFKKLYKEDKRIKCDEVLLDLMKKLC